MSETTQSPLKNARRTEMTQGLVLEEGESCKAEKLNEKKDFYSYLRCLLSEACGEQEGSELCASFYSVLILIDFNVKALEKRLRIANLEDFDKLASFVSEC